MSRRDNGLPGGDWERLADLAPPVADQVLDELRTEGIAAYAAPASPPREAIDARPHPRPTDRVYVPRDAAARAQDVLDRLLPALHAELDAGGAPDVAGGEPDGTQAAEVRTDEDVWAGIVASYSAPAVDPVGRWSVSEDVDDRPGRTAAARDPGAVGGFEDIRAELDALEAAAPTSPGPADDPTDHFVPPPPPPLPTVDVVTRAAWVGLVGGPLFLVLATLLGWGPGGLVGFLAVIAFVGGFVTLVTRMRDEPPEDGGDNGAVV